MSANFDNETTFVDWRSDPTLWIPLTLKKKGGNLWRSRLSKNPGVNHISKPVENLTKEESYFGNTSTHPRRSVRQKTPQPPSLHYNYKSLGRDTGETFMKENRK